MILVHENTGSPRCETMSELMTYAEMESRFPDEWVLILEPETDQHLRVIRGVVACHSKDPIEIDRVALELRPKRSAMKFLAVTPDNEIFAL